MSEEKKEIKILERICKQPYYGYINKSIDRVLKLCMMPNLSSVSNKECEAEIYRKTAYIDTIISMRKKIYHTFFYMRNKKKKKGKKIPPSSADYFFKYFLPSENFLGIILDSLKKGSRQVEKILWTSDTGQTKRIIIPTKILISILEKRKEIHPRTIEMMDKLGDQVRKLIIEKEIIYIPVSYRYNRTSNAGHACLIILRLVGNKIDYYVYDPVCNGIEAINVLAQLVMICICRSMFRHDKRRLTFAWDMLSLSCKHDISIQNYARIYEDDAGYCAIYVLIHIALIYMSMPNPRSPNFSLNDLGDCVTYSLLSRFTPCQVALLSMMFSLVTTQQYARAKNLILEEKTKQTSLESKRTPQHHFEIDEKVLDSFYKWLEYEVRKKNHDYTRLMNYAQTVLRFNTGDWNTALEVVQERLLDKKKRKRK